LANKRGKKISKNRSKHEENDANYSIKFLQERSRVVGTRRHDEMFMAANPMMDPVKHRSLIDCSDDDNGCTKKILGEYFIIGGETITKIMLEICRLFFVTCVTLPLCKKKNQC